MPAHVYPHATVPSASSLCSGSVRESIQPNLRRAFPLPEDHGRDRRFQDLLDAMDPRVGDESSDAPG